MPRLFTRAELRDRVRQRADMVGATLFVPDAEIDTYLNASIDRLNGLVVAGGEDDFTTDATLATTPGSATLSLASLADLFKVRHVECKVNDNWRPMRRWNFAERHLYDNTTGAWGTIERPLAYRALGRAELRLYPVPDGAYSVRVWYVELPDYLDDDSDEYDARLGWDEWVVIDSAIKCVLKEEGDASALVAERQTLLGEIMGHFRTFDEGRPDVVQDVTLPMLPWGP